MGVRLQPLCKAPSSLPLMTAIFPEPGSGFAIGAMGLILTPETTV
jgi:hypothetical protein